MSKYLQKIEDFQEKYLENCMKTAMEITIKELYEKWRESFKDELGDDFVELMDKMEQKAIRKIEKFDLAKELAK